jgi:hypothetical protein
MPKKVRVGHVSEARTVRRHMSEAVSNPTWCGHRLLEICALADAIQASPLS